MDCYSLWKQGGSITCHPTGNITHETAILGGCVVGAAVSSSIVVWVWDHKGDDTAAEPQQPKGYLT